MEFDGWCWMDGVELEDRCWMAGVDGSKRLKQGLFCQVEDGKCPLCVMVDRWIL